MYIKMIIKTREFDQQFNNDLHWITINRNMPLWQKGSYKVKEWNDIITDIDLQARVFYNEKLVDIVSNMLHKLRTRNGPFRFIHMAVGRFEGFDLPWIIDNTGGCQFNLQKAYKWFEWFSHQKLVPKKVIDYIKSKLYVNKLLLRNLIDIENAIHSYAEIVWTEEDIRRGFIDSRGVRYNLLDAMKTETPVLEFLYYYNNDFVAIDVGLVDRGHVAPTSGNMYRYYTNDWYKILKAFRWKLQEQYRPEYYEAMTKITAMIAIRYKLELLPKLSKHSIFTKEQMAIAMRALAKEMDKQGISYKGKAPKVVAQDIYEYVNHSLRDKVTHFAKLLNPNEREKILLHLQRGAEAQIPVTVETMQKRHDINIQCPFFPADMDDFEYLTALAMRMDMDPEHLVECFSQIAILKKTSVRSVINEVVGSNPYSLLTIGNRVLLREQNQKKKSFDMNSKNILQAFVLLYNIP